MPAGTGSGIHWFNSSPRGQMLMHRVAGLVFVALAVMLIFSCVA